MGRQANPELAAEWGQRIAAQRRSGLTVAEFCRQQGVKAGSFYAWKQRLAEARSRRGSASVTRPAGRARHSTSSSTARFVPLALAGSESVAAIVIERRDGLVVRVPCDQHSLRTVLAALSTASFVESDERPC